MMRSEGQADAWDSASGPHATEPASSRAARTATELLKAQEEAARILLASQEQVAILLRSRDAEGAAELLKAQEKAARALLASQAQVATLLRSHGTDGAAELLKSQEEIARTLLASQALVARLLRSNLTAAAKELLDAQNEAATALLAIQSEVAHLLRTNIDLRQRMKERNKELTNINARLQAAAVAKRDFLASMSHELRTPLNSVIGYSGLLLTEAQGDLNEEQKRQLGFISSSGKHLLALVNDLLDLSRVEAGGFELEISDFTIGSVVSSVVDMLRGIAKEKGLEFDTSVSDPGAFLRSDSRAVEQILINLVGNAIKFTESGTVGLDASIGDDDRAVFCVRDTGSGIAEDELEAIFESFHQVATAVGARTLTEGTGLGLSISLSLATCLGGTITASSVLGEGSVFTLDIPACLDED